MWKLVIAVVLLNGCAVARGAMHTDSDAAFEEMDSDASFEEGRPGKRDAQLRTDAAVDAGTDAELEDATVEPDAAPAEDAGQDSAVGTDAGADTGVDGAGPNPFGTQCQPCQTDDDCNNGRCSSAFNGVCRTYCTGREDPACDLATGLLCSNTTGTCGVNLNYFPGGCAEWLNR